MRETLDQLLKEISACTLRRDAALGSAASGAGASVGSIAHHRSGAREKGPRDCYPGKANSGDKPPRPECAPLWHARVDAQLRDVGLTLLIGHHAQAYYLANRCRPTLGETVRNWKDYLPRGYLPLPHPSPRNQLWLARNSWFWKEVLPTVRSAVGSLKL